MQADINVFRAAWVTGFAVARGGHPASSLA